MLWEGGWEWEGGGDFQLFNILNRLIDGITELVVAEFMFSSVNLRPAGRKLPSLGVYRSVNGLNGNRLMV